MIVDLLERDAPSTPRATELPPPSRLIATPTRRGLARRHLARQPSHPFPCTARASCAWCRHRLRLLLGDVDDDLRSTSRCPQPVAVLVDASAGSTRPRNPRPRPAERRSIQCSRTPRSFCADRSTGEGAADFGAQGEGCPTRSGCGASTRYPPQPAAHFIQIAFRSLSGRHPWVAATWWRPKSVARGDDRGVLGFGRVTSAATASALGGVLPAIPVAGLQDSRPERARALKSDASGTSPATCARIERTGHLAHRGVGVAGPPRAPPPGRVEPGRTRRLVGRELIATRGGSPRASAVSPRARRRPLRQEWEEARRPSAGGEAPTRSGLPSASRGARAFLERFGRIVFDHRLPAGMTRHHPAVVSSRGGGPVLCDPRRGPVWRRRRDRPRPTSSMLDGPIIA